MASVASPRTVQRVAAGVLAVVAAAVLLWFGTGLHPLWPLLWLAPLPVLVFAASAPWWASALAAAAAWVLGALNLRHNLHGALGSIARWSAAARTRSRSSRCRRCESRTSTS
jgi:hypothetical protein